MTETAQALEPAFAHVALSVSDLHRSVASTATDWVLARVTPTCRPVDGWPS